jgi:outer membrane protein assembly factor BamB
MNIDFGGRAITVRSIDPNNHWVVSSTIIDCDGAGIGFHFQSGEDVNSVLDGLTITNGSTSGHAIGGGGVCIENASPLIRNCVITNNSSSEEGGGIYSYTSVGPTIINCDIRNNTSFVGGGICSGWSGPTIIGCRISGNHATASGGGIYWSASSATMTINDCNIIGNTADSKGGGIYASMMVKINRSVIAGNLAPQGGGGIYLYSCGMYINNSIVAGNFSQSNGGGVYDYRSGILPEGCTFAGNTAGGSGGGAYFESGGSLSGNNSIFWGNSDSSGTGLTAQISPSQVATALFSCIQDDDPNDADIPFGGEDNGNIDDDPIFVDSANGDYHLQKNSPCIEAGNPLSAFEPGATDIDGQPRVIGRVIDMGADEYGKMIIVTKPVEGEIWATSSKHQIKWSKSGVSSVNILLSADNGENWETIAAGIADTNSYLWELPDDVDSNQCLISIVPGNGDANVVCRESGLFTVRWYPVQPAVPPEWQRRGLLPAPDLSKNKGPQVGCVKWVFDTNGPVSSQVAVTWPYWNSYGVYIGCEDGLIYALDDQGEYIWSCDINTPIVGSPAVGYYWMVYVAGQNGKLYAIDDYGDVRWTHTTDAPVYSTPVVGYSGKIYVCSEDGLVYALGSDGSELWSFETAGPAELNGAILTTPVIERNGAVYIAGLYDPNLYALDANNGSVKWVCSFASAGDPNSTNGGQLFAPPAIGPDGTIYQTLINDPNLYAIDPCTGSILWSTSLQLDPNANSSGWSSPAVGPDGTIYVSFDDPYLRAVRPNGTIKWTTRLGVVGGFTISVDRDGFIYAASDDGYVCVVNPDGQEISRFKGNDWVTFPAIADDGTLIVSDSNNRVWAITNAPCGEQPPVLHWPADVQPSWVVDFMDFATLANNWLVCTDPLNEAVCGAGISTYGLYAPGDINRNQYVDFQDFAVMTDKWLMEAN